MKAITELKSKRMPPLKARLAGGAAWGTGDAAVRTVAAMGTGMGRENGTEVG